MLSIIRNSLRSSESLSSSNSYPNEVALFITRQRILEGDSFLELLAIVDGNNNGHFFLGKCILSYMKHCPPSRQREGYKVSDEFIEKVYTALQIGHSSDANNTSNEQAKFTYEFSLSENNLQVLVKENMMVCIEISCFRPNQLIKGRSNNTSLQSPI